MVGIGGRSVLGVEAESPFLEFKKTWAAPSQTAERYPAEYAVSGGWCRGRIFGEWLLGPERPNVSRRSSRVHCGLGQRIGWLKLPRLFQHCACTAHSWRLFGRRVFAK